MRDHDDDPIIAKIRQCANRIRSITSCTDSMGVEPYTAVRLGQMLSDIQDEAESIWKLTGVTDLDRQLTEALDDAVENTVRHYPMYEDQQFPADA